MKWYAEISENIRIYVDLDTLVTDWESHETSPSKSPIMHIMTNKKSAAGGSCPRCDEPRGCVWFVGGVLYQQ